MINNPKLKLNELAKLIDAKIQGNGNCEIAGIAPLDRAQPGQISFLSNAKFRSYLATTQASAVIVSPKEAADCTTNALIVENPYLGYAKIAHLFKPQLQNKPGIHPAAIIGEHCQIDPSAAIGPGCVIGDHAIIGAHTVISPGCVIGENVHIGMDCHLWANVTVYYNVQIGHRALIHSGAVIGSDGFGMARDKDKWCKIPQLGSVLIGNDVEIGANTCIDRGALNNTVIEDDVKLDNLIQIAHNVHIGAHTAIAGCTAIAGSVRIGKNCMIGGSVSITDNIEIVDNVFLMGTSTVEIPVTKPGKYGSGLGLYPGMELIRNVVRFRQLGDIIKRITKLEKASDERDGN